MLKAAAGIDLVHVPYNGADPGWSRCSRVNVELMITPPPILLPMARAGRVQLIAVSSLKRSPAMPDVPTIAESGFPGFESTVWYLRRCAAGPAAVPSSRSCMRH
jgi:tripartite-type tricarboxylate transporter receptor subunit TctC